MVKCFKCGSECNENAEKIYGGNFICETCNKNIRYVVCHICGEQVPENMYEEIFNGDDDEYYNYCPLCYKEEKGIYPHDYKPVPQFHSLFNVDRKHNLHVGVELEMQFDNYWDFINDFDKNISDNMFYLKYDGSLDEDSGIEIVSHPMTIGIALKQFELLFNLIDKQNVDLNGCGLHFHLDKTYLNERQIRNIDYIINTFTDSVEKIGGRNIVNHEWASNHIKHRNEWGMVTNTDYKYRAVNFCKHTIELRCFDSTDDWFEFSWRLKAVFALVEYANIHTFDYFSNMDDNSFWVCFKNYIDKYCKKLI